MLNSGRLLPSQLTSVGWCQRTTAAHLMRCHLGSGQAGNASADSVGHCGCWAQAPEQSTESEAQRLFTVEFAHLQNTLAQQLQPLWEVSRTDGVVMRPQEMAIHQLWVHLQDNKVVPWVVQATALQDIPAERETQPAHEVAVHRPANFNKLARYACEVQGNSCPPEALESRAAGNVACCAS